MFRNTLKLGLLGLAVAATSALTSLQIFGQGSAQFAENVPLTYTVVASDAVSLAADELETNDTIYRGARRGDGSTARITYQVADDGTPIESRTVFDLAQSRYVILDSSLKSVTTTSLTDTSVESKRNRRRGCEGTIVDSRLGHDVILRTSTPPVAVPAVAMHGQMREETLIAPSLGCLVMETSLIMTYPDGSERVVRSERVVDVRVGAPSAAFFGVPPGYAEMSPAARLTALGRGANFAVDEMVQHFEQVYQERKLP